MNRPVRVYSYWHDHPHVYVQSSRQGCDICGYGVGAIFHNTYEIERFQTQQAFNELKAELLGVFGRFIVSVDWSKRAPRFYGRAWTQWDRGRRVCMPIPFNFIAGIGRAIYIFLARGFYPHVMCPTCHHRSDKQLPVTPRHEIAGASVYCPARGYVQSCEGFDCVGARCSILNPRESSQ